MSVHGPAVRVNGTETPLEGRSLAELLDRLGYPEDRSGMAVAVNGEIVPRGDWSTRSLTPGDEIEVVGAVQGG